MTERYVQEPPNAVQIELSEGCNLFCSFCGLRGIREKPMTDLKFMEMNLAKHLGKALATAIRNHGWNPRVEFAMHGEPTLNPSWLELARQIRGHLPHQPLMLTTNGYGFLHEGGKRVDLTRTVELFAAAKKVFNVIAIDDYEYANLGRELRARLTEAHMLYADYPADRDANPHRRRHPQLDHDIVFIEDISKATEGTHSHLCNHAGSAGPKTTYHKRCAKPFRELSFRYDGKVAICCNDWRGEYVIGSLFEFATIEDLWQSDAFVAARKKLYHGQRDFGPCDGCDARSTRVGLLPDKKGLASLPEPDAVDLAVIGAALSAGPLAAPVRRSWEPVLDDRPIH